MDGQNKFYHLLKEKWIERHKKLQETVWQKHGQSLQAISDNAKQIAIGTAAGLMLFTNPVIPQATIQTTKTQNESSQTLSKKIFVISDLKKILPEEVSPLNKDQEKQVGEVLERYYDIKVTPQLNGIRLNRSYGLIGAEQHLARYPGDNMGTHFDNPQDAVKYYSSGMAPGLGGWGYFAYSANTITEGDKLREKYYIAVQTFLAPGFYDNVRKYIDFFRFRKMLLVNPQNGKAIVTVIGDAGPAEWTGKHLGGSPEVMSYLERFDGAQRGPVLYFFIDDPENKVPLGPIEV